MARSLQRSKGIPDSEFRVFVGADKRESYDKVRIIVLSRLKYLCMTDGPRAFPGHGKTSISETCEW